MADNLPAHSRLGASSMYRWAACPASVRFTRDMPESSSAYAEEGTRAHDLASRILLGESPECDDAEMRDAVSVYVQAIKDIQTPKATLLVEHKFDLSAVYPGCFGTADAVVYQPETRTLHVVDYKHGAGIAVEAVGNPQLRYYALGALMTTKFKPKMVQMSIVQPRCAHPDGPIRSETIDALDLLDFRADLIKYAKATEDESAPFASGDHCRFCRGAGVCPSLAATALEAAKLDFRPGHTYDPAALKQALDARDAVKAWLSALDEFAYREAEAGRCPEGYKLVAKRATRKWKSEGDVAEFMQDRGFTPSQIYDRSIKSPAQLEKLWPKKGDVPAEFHALTESVSSGHTLVPITDPRPPAITSAQADFTAVPNPN